MFRSWYRRGHRERRSRSAGIAITPDARTAFVTNHGDGTVTPITLATRTPGTPIRVGANPSAIAISPDGTKAYVATGAGVVPINVANRSAGSLIPIPDGAVGTALIQTARRHS